MQRLPMHPFIFTTELNNAQAPELPAWCAAGDGSPPQGVVVKGRRKWQLERAAAEAQQSPQCGIMNQASGHNSVGRSSYYRHAG